MLFRQIFFFSLKVSFLLQEVPVVFIKIKMVPL
jgi:hypothetical protein